MADDQDTIEQKFGFFVIKKVNKKTGSVQVELKTRGEGIPLPEAIIILEGWMEKVKKELQKPYVENLKFGK